MSKASLICDRMPTSSPTETTTVTENRSTMATSMEEAPWLQKADGFFMHWYTFMLRFVELIMQRKIPFVLKL